MDFGNMLQYLQSLLGNKQTMQGTEFGQNLALQQQELGQRGTQFDASLAAQQKAQEEANALAQGQLAQQGSEFTTTSALQKQIQDQANALAQQAQQYNQRYQTQNTVTPGSALWFQMQQLLKPAATTGAGGSSSGYSGIPNAPFKSPAMVTFTPTRPGWI